MRNITKWLRYQFIYFLWGFKKYWRNYCWSNAVMWAEGYQCELFEKADHNCHYCLTCNTKEEIEKYRLEE